jgi:acyl-coenzyme A thioesterase PaaI-like protein
VTTEAERTHLLTELGFALRQVDDRIEGSAAIIPEMCVPETAHLRTSVLVAWTDHLGGLLACLTMTPRVPVTLQLDLHLLAPAPGSGTISCVGRTVKAGRSVCMAAMEFTTEDGEPIAVGTTSFMVAPDPTLSLPSDLSLGGPPPVPSLQIPFAERAGCERIAPGVASLPRTDDGLNAAGTVNGGLLALVAEEAVLSASPPGTTLASMSLCYLRAVRVGPATATAKVRSGVGTVEVCDTGDDDRLGVTVTTRAFA